jgi:hypothetical protein
VKRLEIFSTHRYAIKLMSLYVSYMNN